LGLKLTFFGVCAEAKNVTALARMKEKYFIWGLKMDVWVWPRNNDLCSEDG
jgi:hypothetical protein